MSIYSVLTRLNNFDQYPQDIQKCQVVLWDTQREILELRALEVKNPLTNLAAQRLEELHALSDIIHPILRRSQMFEKMVQQIHNLSFLSVRCSKYLMRCAQDLRNLKQNPALKKNLEGYLHFFRRYLDAFSGLQYKLSFIQFESLNDQALQKIQRVESFISTKLPLANGINQGSSQLENFAGLQRSENEIPTSMDWTPTDSKGT